MSVGDEFDPKRVLVVDDEAPMLRTHGRVLEAHGLNPVLMADPVEALEEAKLRTPAVVLLDREMPQMNGIHFAFRIRNHYERACPPLILVSARWCELTPFDRLLFEATFPKPYSVDSLVECVRYYAREHYDRRHAPSEILGKDGAEMAREEDGEA